MTVQIAPPAAPEAPPRAHLQRWVWAAAATTATAGVLHALTAVDRLGAPEIVVGFFVVTALGQLAAATGLSVAAVTGQRPGAGVLTGLLVVTVGLVALYLVAYTTDLLVDVAATDPTAIATGHAHTTVPGPVALGGAPPVLREPPGFLGTATVAVELFSALALVALLPRRGRRLATDALAVLGVAAWALWLTGVLG